MLNRFIKSAFGLILGPLYLSNSNETNSNVILINQKKVKDLGIECFKPDFRFWLWQCMDIGWV